MEISKNFYYIIDGNIYKYACKNKNRKNILDLRCTDTSYPAQANFYRKIDEFKLNIFTQHKIMKFRPMNLMKYIKIQIHLKANISKNLILKK